MSDPPPPSTWKPSPWPRLAVIAALQLPPIALICWGRGLAALWVAGLWGSVVCCAGTDSGWRWTNRILIAVAILWLLVPLILTEF